MSLRGSALSETTHRRKYVHLLCTKTHTRTSVNFLMHDRLILQIVSQFLEIQPGLPVVHGGDWAERQWGWKNKKWREGKKERVRLISTTSLPLLYKRWSTLHKIYYIQAEILSSAGAIHHPGHETLWMIPPNYVDQPCLRGRFNLVTLVTPGTLHTPAPQHVPIFWHIT